MPEGAWGRPWQEWCTPEVHEAKARIYPQVVTEMPPRKLPLLTDIFLPYQGSVLTAASHRAATLLLNLLDPPQWMRLMGWSLTQEQRADVLVKAAAIRPVVYFDDDPTTCATISEWLGSQLKGVVHVNEGVYTQYINGKERGRWTPSSWQVEATSGSRA